MSLTNLTRRARGKNIVAKVKDNTWKGILTDYDNRFIELSRVSSVDSLLGSTPADGTMLLPLNEIEYMQVLGNETA